MALENIYYFLQIEGMIEYFSYIIDVCMKM